MFNTRPLPKVSSWSLPFWKAAAERKLVIQHCKDCKKKIMYPRRFCPNCLSSKVEFIPAKGTGEIYTLTKQVLGAPTGFDSNLPYVIAVIRLDEGVQMMTNIIGEGKDSAKIGDRVLVDFIPIDGSDIVLPMFRLEGFSK